MPTNPSEREFIHALCNELATAKTSLELCLELFEELPKGVEEKVRDSLAALQRLQDLIDGRRKGTRRGKKR